MDKGMRLSERWFRRTWCIWLSQKDCTRPPYCWFAAPPMQALTEGCSTCAGLSNRMNRQR